MVYGKGINDMPYGWRLETELNYRIYECWKSMIKRCYSKKYQEKCPTYKDCYVCEKWLKLSGFVEDIKFIDNYNFWETHQHEKISLDKDIKSNNKNKCYCLEQCMFTSISENSKQSHKTRIYKKHSEETIKKIKDNHPDFSGKNHPRSKKVDQFDLNDNFIKTWECIKEAEKVLEISHISNCCSGLRNTAGGFKWKYHEE